MSDTSRHKVVLPSGARVQMDEKLTDAAADRGFANGMLLGWNLCVAGNGELFDKIRLQRLRDARAANKPKE